MENSKWLTVLKNTTVLDLCLIKNKDLIVVKETDTLKSVLNTLRRNNILSVPVVERGEFAGIVDVLDIAGYVLATWKAQSGHLEDEHFPCEVFFEAPVSDVLNFSSVDKPEFIEEDKSVFELIKVFRHPKNYARLHRVAVLKNEKVVDVISQSDVIHFVAGKVDLLPQKKAKEAIANVKGLIRSPIMIRIDSSFIDALERLYKNRISGLALVDHEFKLSGNLSASDLRGMNPSAFDFFTGSVLQFLAKGTTSPAKATLHVGPGNTFEEVIQLLSREKVHRLYVTNKTGNPIGLVTLIDIIARLL